MPPFHQAIASSKKIMAGPGPENRAIVPNACGNAGCVKAIILYQGFNPPDEPEFADVRYGLRHKWKRLTVLKSRGFCYPVSALAPRRLMA